MVGIQGRIEKRNVFNLCKSGVSLESGVPRFAAKERVRPFSLQRAGTVPCPAKGCDTAKP